MEFKGTKGSWIYKKRNPTLIQVRNLDNKLVCELENYERNKQIISIYELEYNALLISKSPELLQALENTLEILYKCDCPKELQEAYANVFMNYNELIKQATTF